LLPAGAVFVKATERTVPVKARITYLAVILGAVLLALVLADGPWPGG